MPSIADLLVKIAGDTSGLDKALKQSQAELAQFARRAEQIGQSFSGIGARLTLGVSAPLAGIAVSGLKLAGTLEQNKIAFETMLGSAERASSHLRELQAFAATTPFQFTELVDASKRMQALGFSAERVIPNLRAIGGAAAALGLGAEGINRITLALGQMQSKGKVAAEELNQLTEAGIPAYKILAKVLNTDVAGAMQLVEKRAVDAAKVVPAFIEELNVRFGGLLEKQSKTLVGQFSNLQDKLKETATSLGEVLRPQAERTVQALQGMADGLGVVLKNVEQLPEPVKNAAAGLLALTVAAGPAALVLGGVASGVGNIATAARATLPALTSFAAGLTGAGSLAIGAGFAAIAAGVSIIGFETFRATARLMEMGAAQEQLGRRNAIQGLLREGKTAEEIRALGFSVEELKNSLSGFQIPNLAEKFDFQAPVKARIAIAGATAAVGDAAQKATRHILVFAEALQNERLSRYEAGVRAMAKAVIDARTAFQPFGEKLELVGSKLPDQVLGFEALAEVLANAGKVVANLPDFSGLWERGAEAAHTYEGVLKQVGVTSQASLDGEVSRLRRLVAELENLNRLGVGTFDDVVRAREKLAEAEQRAANVSTRSTAQSAGAYQKFAQQIRTSLNDVSRGIADVIVSGENLGKMLSRIGQEFGKFVIRLALDAQFDRIAKAIQGITAQTSTLGKVLGAVFGTGTSALGTVRPTPPFAGGSNSSITIPFPGGGAAGGAGSAASGAVGGVLGAVGAIGAAVSAVSGVISNFQLARQETSLNAIELNTRKTAIILGESSDSIHANIKAYLPAAKELRDYWIGGAGGTLQLRMTSLIEDIKYAIEKRLATGAGPTVVMNNTFNVSSQSAAEEVARKLKQMGVAPA